MEKGSKNRLHNKSDTSEPSLTDWDILTSDWDIELPDWKLEPVDWDIKLGEWPEPEMWSVEVPEWPTLTGILEPTNSEMQGGEHE